jgi:hypothetical protein
MKELVKEHININSYRKLQEEALKTLIIDLLSCENYVRLTKVRNPMDLLLLYLLEYSFVNAHNIEITNTITVGSMKDLLGYIIYLTCRTEDNKIDNQPAFNLLARLQSVSNTSFFIRDNDRREFQKALREGIKVVSFDHLSDYLSKHHNYLILQY